MAIDTKFRELELSIKAVIRGESCFEKSAFEDTVNPHPHTQNSTSGERISQEISDVLF